MRLVTLSLAFLVALSGGLTAQDGDKVTLDWKFKKGDSLRYEMSMNMEMDFGGMEIGQEMLFRLLWEVQDVTADGTGTVKCTYERIKVKMDGGPMSSDYDSDKDKKADESDLMARIFSAFVGQSLTMQMTKGGQCLKFEGMEKLVDAAMKELPEEMQAMGGMMKANLTDDYFKSTMQMQFGFLPKESVGKGDVWNDTASLSMGMMGKMDMKTKSTLKEIRAGKDSKEAVISQETKFDFKADEAGGGPMGAMEITNSKQKNEVVWLVDKGCAQSTKGTTTMDMSVGGQEMTMVWKMEMKLIQGLAPVATPGGAEKETPKEK